MTPEEKLDTVLGYFLNPDYAENNNSIDAAYLLSIYKSDKNIDDETAAEFDMIIRKLCEELKFINYNSFTNTVSLSFDGKNFKGFTYKETLRVQEQNEIAALKTLEKRLKEKVVVQNRWLIVIGSIVSTASLIEIVKFLYGLFHG